MYREDNQNGEIGIGSNNNLPQIKTQSVIFGHDEWSLDYPDYFEHFIVSNYESTQNELQKILNASLSDKELKQIKIQTCPFLVHVDKVAKNIKLCTTKASTELFFLKLINNHNLIESKYLEFIDAFTTLSLNKTTNVIDSLSINYSLHNIEEDFENHEFSQLFTSNLSSMNNAVKQYRPSIFERISDFGLELTSEFALIRIHLLKFLAILPSLDHDNRGTHVKKIFNETFSRLISDNAKACRLKTSGQNRPLNSLIIFSFVLARFVINLLPAKIAALLIRGATKFMAKRFIAGVNIEDARKSLRDLRATSRESTIDQLGELVVSEVEADQYKDNVIEIIKGMKNTINSGEKNQAGILCAHVSIKVTALCSDFNENDFNYTYNQIAPRLNEILITAKNEKVFINIDAEHYHYRDIVLEIYAKVLESNPSLSDFSDTGIVLQAYLTDAYPHLVKIIELAKRRGLIMPIRLVKGAYWDAETIEADVYGFDAPQFLNKEETDIHFKQICHVIMQNYPHVQLCVASHNIVDHCFAKTLREISYKSHPIIEHQSLHMTYEALSVGLSKLNLPVRNYVPIGSLLVGMAYLVRRIMENSSQVGILSMMRSQNTSKNDYQVNNKLKMKIKKGQYEYSKTIGELSPNFYNCTPVQLYKKKEYSEFLSSFHNFTQNELGKKYENPFKMSGEIKEKYSNSSTDLLVGSIKSATIEDAYQALSFSTAEFRNGIWAHDHVYRISCMLRAAQLMISQRLSLSHLIVYESGKTHLEALADVDEAIDFLNFYAREELKLIEKKDYLKARGVFSVIAPWNFPLAIPCGMTAAALVAGNTVILKSAEQTPLIAQKLVDILHSSGVPHMALIHLPGKGSIVGKILVESEKTAGIVFTGSKKIGLLISKTAGKRIYHNPITDETYPTKVITEMGGKNAIVVTANAELDETISGILYSAFGHSGQKCSACSRIIVHNSIKEIFMRRLKEAANRLKVGSSMDFSTILNPLISQNDVQRIREVAKLSRKEIEKYGGKIIIDRTNEVYNGFQVGPFICEINSARALDKESMASQEHFGPLIHIIGYNNDEQAIEIFNSTEYALTGAIFSQSQDEIDFFISAMECGNIYVNRSSTGARVAIEPFGGFKMSGTGPKAGGRNYLESFHVRTNNYSMKSFDYETTASDYRFDLSEALVLSPKIRLNLLKRCSAELLKSYSTLFKTSKENDKEIINHFINWCSYHYLNLVSNKHQNKIIPGQLSFNMKNLLLRHGALISYTPQPSIEVILYFLSSFVSGCGLNILCMNDESAYFWEDILKMFNKIYDLSTNIKIDKPTPTRLEEFLKEEDIGFIISDVDHHLYGVLYSMSLKHSEKHVRRILTPVDSPDPHDFKSFLDPFVLERAFAINTMRHGAPLNLDLPEEQL